MSKAKAKAAQNTETDEALTLASFSSLLETKLASHRQGISDDFNKALTALEGKLDGISTTVTANSFKLTALETSVNDQDRRLSVLEEKTSTLTTSNAKLAAKVLDLESRSRRNNIRVIGLPETIEGTQPTAFFSNMLGEVFGDVLGSPPDVKGPTDPWLLNQLLTSDRGQS